MDDFITGVTATIDAVAAHKHSRKRVDISFDEWNVWYQSRFEAGGLPPIDEAGPRIEDTYSALDSVVVGDLLISLLNHADRVRIACLTQLVNVIAPIRTEPGGPAWRQATFHPIAAVAATARGHSLVTRVTSPGVAPRHGDVPAVAAAATFDPATGQVSAYLTNRSAESATVTIRSRGASRAAWSGRLLIANDKGPRDCSTAAGYGFTPLATAAGPEPDILTVSMPADSWAALTDTM